MKARQLLKTLVPFSRQLHFDPAPVAAPGVSSNQPGNLASRNQRHNPVMLCLQALGKFSNRRPLPPGEALDLEHQKVLQRGDAFLVRHLFAEVEIAAQLVAKLGKRLKIGF